MANRSCWSAAFCSSCLCAQGVSSQLTPSGQTSKLALYDQQARTVRPQGKLAPYALRADQPSGALSGGGIAPLWISGAKAMRHSNGCMSDLVLAWPSLCLCLVVRLQLHRRQAPSFQVLGVPRTFRLNPHSLVVQLQLGISALREQDNNSIAVRNDV